MPSASEADVVVLSFPKYGIEIDKWLSYRCNSVFTTPSDGFDFTLAAESIDAPTRLALKNGELFQIKVNGHTQASGYIDRVAVSSSRSSGTIWRIEGCDRLAQAVRSGIDPRIRFKEGQTLLDVLRVVFAPFGYTDANMLSSNDVNRDVRTGGIRGDKVSKKGKELKSFAVHQNRPYPGEGAFAFASRLAQRFGLWIWLSAEGNSLIVGLPTYDQPPRYRLFDKFNADQRLSNIEDGEARYDTTRQPSCIVASGFSYGGEADRARYKVIITNELVGIGADGNYIPSVAQIVAANPDAIVIPPRTVFAQPAMRPHPAAQPIYLHDQESQTPDQLQAFARRELALYQRDSLVVNYVVEGHTNEGSLWCVDTMVDVDDDYRDIHEPLWVLGRTFEKSRQGTRTHLHLIRPYTMAF